MSLGIRVTLTVTMPVLTGVLAWWCVMLGAPVLLIRRWRRRQRDAPRRRVGPSSLCLRRGMAAPSGPAGSLSGGVASRRLDAVGLADAADAPVPSGGAFQAHGRTPGPGARADAHEAASLSDETLGPLCRYVDFRRRLELALAELERKLAPLPADQWRIESYPLTGERGNTLILLGGSGVFVISATYAPGHWDDVIAASTLARKVQLLLPGYPGQVHPAICHPFTSAPPRLWHRPDDQGDWVGAWVLGGDSLIEWLEHFGTVHGLQPADLEHFDELTRPNWLKPAIASPPSWPPMTESTRPG